MLVPQDNAWILRKESQIAEDVLWRAQKGRCWDFVQKNDDDDVLLDTYCPVDDEAVEPDEEEFDAYFIELAEIMDEAELPATILTGLFDLQSSIGYYAGSVYHTAA